ncbi:MAG: nucleotidyltransferase substrate binding protein [Proteobacteria bacterium]|nr:nucleotidyltransferase substrate binding protein [Pseudomonadota bacterium]
MNVTDYKFFHRLEQLPFVEKIWLYGSRARGDSWDRSDIDIAIECPQATYPDWQKVRDIIEDADTLLKIDCVRLDELKESSLFVQHILKDRKILFQRTGRNLREEDVPLFQREEKQTIEPRWKSNFDDLGKALERLKEILELPLDDHQVVMDATIKRFEFCIELCWKNFKNFLQYEKKKVISPRDAVSQAYQMEWIDSEKLWLEMLDDRNFTSHNYHNEKAEDVYVRIKEYYPKMKAAYERLKQISSDPSRT